MRVRSALAGVYIRAVPGAGNSIANPMARHQARNAAKTPEKFDTCTRDRVIASGAGNSLISGGGLIPMIARGIPSSDVGAVLMLRGISVGPRLPIDNPDLVCSIFLAVLIDVSQDHRHRQEHPVPGVLAPCVVGVFALNNRITDVYILFFIGGLGYLMKKMDYPMAPLVLGVALSPIAATDLWRALMTDEDWTLFLTRPIPATFLALAALSLVLILRRRWMQGRSA